MRIRGVMFTFLDFFINRVTRGSFLFSKLSFIVNVSVSNMNEVCGYSFDLFFNTSVVNGISINRSELFINSCTKTFWDSSIPTPGIDSSTGVIAYYDGCWGCGNETVTGNDVVSFTFKALFPGINYFNLGGLFNPTHISDKNGNEVTHELYNGYVTVPVGQYRNLSLNTTNTTFTINASSADVFIELKTNSPLTGEWINITTFKENYSTPSLFKLDGVKYVVIDASTGLKDNLNWTIIRIYYTGEEIGTLLEETLKMYWWNGSAWIEIESGVNVNENYVWANVTHFSDYTLGGEIKPDFAVDSIDIPVPVISGRNTIINVTVLNNENINLTFENVNVSLFIDGNFYDSKTINLTNKHNITVNFNWIPDEVRRYNLTVLLNSNFILKELIGSNNESTKNLFAYSECDLNYDNIIISDYNDLIYVYRCFIGVNTNCDKIQFRDWAGMKREYECFTGKNY